MPELVEVETTKKALKEKIINQKIIDVKVYLDKIVYNKKDEFISNTKSKVIKDINRRGKWLLIEIDDKYIVVHFRMEGRFYLLPKSSDIKKHDYVVFELNDYSLHYNDPRLFGKMEVIDKDKIDNFFKEKKLGYEYDDINLTPKYLKECFKNRNVAIKKVLLEQRYINGIGNIYADEILFESNVNPNTKANKLSIKKLQDIIDNTKLVFEKSLKYKGTYHNIDGIKGDFEKHLMVHMRENKKCYVCGNIIKKIKVGSRGTYYCPCCQKK